MVLICTPHSRIAGCGSLQGIPHMWTAFSTFLLMIGMVDHEFVRKYCAQCVVCIQVNATVVVAIIVGLPAA